MLEVSIDDVSHSSQKQQQKKPVDMIRYPLTFHGQRYTPPERAITTHGTTTDCPQSDLSLQEKIELSKKVQQESERNFDEIRNDLITLENSLYNKSGVLVHKMLQMSKIVLYILRDTVSDMGEDFEDIQNAIVQAEAKREPIRQQIRDVERFRDAMQDTTLSAILKQIDAILPWRQSLTKQIAEERERSSESGKETIRIQERIADGMRKGTSTSKRLSWLQTQRDKLYSGVSSMREEEKGRAHLEERRLIEKIRKAKKSLNKNKREISDQERESVWHSEMSREIIASKKYLKAVRRYETYIHSFNKKIGENTLYKAFSTGSAKIDELKQQEEAVKKALEEARQQKKEVTDIIVRRSKNENQTHESAIHSSDDEMSSLVRNIASFCLVKIEQDKEKILNLEKKCLALEKQIKRYEDNMPQKIQPGDTYGYFNFFVKLHQYEKEKLDIQRHRENIQVVHHRFEQFRRACELERVDEGYTTATWKKLEAEMRSVTTSIADLEKDPLRRNDLAIERSYQELLETARLQESFSYFTKDIQGQFDLLQKVLKIPREYVTIPEEKREEFARYQLYLAKLVGKKHPARVNAKRYEEILDVQIEYLQKQQKEIEVALQAQKELNQASEDLLFQDQQREFLAQHAEHQAEIAAYLAHLKKGENKHEKEIQEFTQRKEEIESAYAELANAADVFMDGSFDLRLETLRRLVQGKYGIGFAPDSDLLQGLIAKMELLKRRGYLDDIAELAAKEWKCAEKLDEKRYHARTCIEEREREKVNIESSLKNKRASKISRPLAITNEHALLSQITEFIDTMKKFEVRLTGEIKAVHERLKGRMELQKRVKHCYLLEQHILPAGKMPTGFAPESGQKMYVSTKDLACTHTAVRMILSDSNPQLAEREKEIAATFHLADAEGGVSYNDIPAVLKKLNHPVAYASRAIGSLYDVREKLQFDQEGRCLPLIIAIGRPEIPDYALHSIVCDRIFEMNVNKRVETYMLIRDSLLDERFFVRLDHLNEVFDTRIIKSLGKVYIPNNVVLPVIEPEAILTSPPPGSRREGDLNT